jgi:hypothetical protein
VGYKVVLNSDYDQGASADIGILWKKQRSDHPGSGVVNGLAVVGGILGGLLLLIIVSSAVL